MNEMVMGATDAQARPQAGAKESFTLAAGLSTKPVLNDSYVSPAFFELEKERVFGRAWLCMGRIDQLPHADAFFVKEVEVCKASVLVTRDASGTVRAFHNVCAHRGNLVVFEKCGTSSRLRCDYHGWTYKNDGELIGVPDQRQFFDLDKKKCGLTPIAVDTWEGWIFINLQRKPELSLKEFLGPYAESYAGVPFGVDHRTLVIEAKFNANWKLIMDAFAESYHVPAIHPSTLAPGFSNPINNKYARPLSGSTFGLHSAWSAYGNDEYAAPPGSHVERLACLVDTGGLLGSDVNDEVLRLRAHPAINPTKEVCWSADVTSIFPNFNIDYSTGGYWTHEFWPLARDRTHWILTIRIPEATSVRHRLQLEHYAARWCEVVLEDVTNCERIQKGLESGAKDHMNLQDGEFMIRHHQETLRKWVNAATVADAMK
ncbi:aromatic ring-hydroxylating dioxygenase subunit alpha [Methylibium sp.]|uniref:aromatic ring-hydroxylating oxygenase subunit alpha n=1 Tax=Methylibium sp. TaxID=2067992 RepID=UPI00286BEFB8|nr:aromatic ring-hydroxylating dioxygenase subunit alpha [Methylibium sp.]